MTQVLAVTGAAVQAWAAVEAQGPASAPSVAVALRGAWCRLAHARVSPDQRVRTGLVPIRDGGTLVGTLPLETCADGVWVARPGAAQTRLAPVW